MKPKDKNSAQAAASSKQKKQVLVLGGLMAVLAVVLFIQFGGKSPDAAPAAMALEQPGAAAAPATPDAGAPAPAPADPNAVAGAPAAPVVPTPAPVDNPVLSHPVEGDGLVHSPFSNFWNVAQTGGGATPVAAAPTVTLNATMPSSTRPLAIIDGELHFVGDSIGGWELADVQARSIVLRSPANATITIEMPLLSGSSPVPGAAGG